MHKFIQKRAVEKPIEEQEVEEKEHANEQDHVEVVLEEPEEEEHVEANINEEHVKHNHVDIFNPRRWERLNSDEIKLLVEKGLKRDNNIVNVFRKGLPNGNLDGEGYNNWHHASTSVKNHEVSLDHLTNMNSWFEIRKRLKLNETIDKTQYEQFKKERDYWIQVLLRIVALVKFLAKNNLAFRGTKEKLYQKGNGNFLGLVEMLEEFDPVIKEHVRRIINDEIKEAKYYSIILDCTPDSSHQEQITIIVRYLKFSSNSVTVEESFSGFLDVNDTTGKGLFDIIVEELKSFGLELDDMSGQGYDNGANMKGKHQRERVFFGKIQRMYTIFANSNNRWQILKDNVKSWSLKSLSQTRWESRVESVKVIKLQLADVREALLEVGEKYGDLAIADEATTIAENIGFDFLVSIIMYEVLEKVNIVSKRLQSKYMHLEIAIKEIKRLIDFFKEFRENGFSKQ
ncbi:uncharacterized protein LOC143616240 [Bidens hawaiensis]|uniref:uncharacterized protein LOC143616240 n=1 Tax=Bidens hawaiensis TaxID=980011 RepID=UPI00404A1E26